MKPHKVFHRKLIASVLMVAPSVCGGRIWQGWLWPRMSAYGFAWLRFHLWTSVLRMP